MKTTLCQHQPYERCPHCSPAEALRAKSCGPTRHHACACREAAVAKLVEALEAIEQGPPLTLKGAQEIARVALDEWRKP